ncbi:MAG: L,D-transpeptidase Cds6 family protein, partial [Rhodoferax sp.]
DNANAAVPPKLALIRDIFTSTSGKPTRPVAVAAAPTTVPPAAPASVSKPTAAASAGPAPAGPAATAAVRAPAASVPVQVAAAQPKHAPASVPVAAPVVVNPPASAAATPGAPEAVSGKAAVETAIKGWVQAWSSRDVKAYLAAYGKEFSPPGAMDRKAWEEERRQRILGKSSISVRLDGLAVVVNGEHAQAKFRQEYKAGELAVSSRKTLDLARSGERWYIVKETVGH